MATEKTKKTRARRAKPRGGSKPTGDGTMTDGCPMTVTFTVLLGPFVRGLNRAVNQALKSGWLEQAYKTAVDDLHQERVASRRRKKKPDHGLN